VLPAKGATFCSAKRLPGSDFFAGSWHQAASASAHRGAEALDSPTYTFILSLVPRYAA
jgi:hypothetical protein